MAFDWAGLFKLLERFPLQQLLAAVVLTAITESVLPAGHIRDALDQIDGRHGAWVSSIVILSAWLLALMFLRPVWVEGASFLNGVRQLRHAVKRTHQLLPDERILLQHFIDSKSPVLDAITATNAWPKAVVRLLEAHILRTRTNYAEYEVVPAVRAYLERHPELLNPVTPETERQHG